MWYYSRKIRGVHYEFRIRYLSICAYFTWVMNISERVCKLWSSLGKLTGELRNVLVTQNICLFASDWSVLGCGTFHFEPGQSLDNRITLLLIFTLCPSYSSILFDLFVMNIATDFSLEKIKNYIATLSLLKTHIFMFLSVCVYIYVVDPWTTQSLGEPTVHAVRNLHRT